MIAMRAASKSADMSGFFEEVQRRKVHRVVAAYVVAAGFIIQIASVVFPAWELPNWTLRLIIVLLLPGFPLAAVLAWPTTSRRAVSKRQPRRPRIGSGISFCSSAARSFCQRSRDFSSSHDPRHRRWTSRSLFCLLKT